MMTTRLRLPLAPFEIPVTLRRIVQRIDRAPALAWFVATALLSFVVLAPVITRAFEFDDIHVLYKAIVNAPDPFSVVTQFDGQKTGGSWRPFLHVVLWFEWRAFGTNALAYHAVNVLAHATTAFMVGAVAFELSGRRVVGRIAGALFIVQPFPEGIAWIVGGPLNIMSVLFYVTALFFHIRSRRSGGRGWITLTPVFLVLSLASYEIGLTFIVTVVLYDVLFHWERWDRRGRLERTGAAAGVALAVSALFLAARASILGTFVGSYGQSAIFGQASLPVRIGTIVRAFWTPANGALPASDLLNWLVLVFHVALVLALLGIGIRRPPLRPIVFGVALAAIGLIPFSGFIVVYEDLISSRYLYLTTVGLTIAIAAALAGRYAAFAIPVALLLVASLAGMLSHNTRPWAMAGAMVDGTVRAAVDGPIQTFGVPLHDIYGAYTFGTASNINEYPGANGMDVLMDRSSIEDGRAPFYWNGSSVVPLGAHPLAQWTASDLASWNWSTAVKSELRGSALVVVSGDGDPWSWSPTLSMPSGGTDLVVATIDAPVDSCKQAQLIWRYARAGDRNAHVQLAAGRHEYVFVHTGVPEPDTLVGLRFDPLLCPGTAQVFQLAVGGRGP